MLTRDQISWLPFNVATEKLTSDQELEANSFTSTVHTLRRNMIRKKWSRSVLDHPYFQSKLPKELSSKKKIFGNVSLLQLYSSIIQKSSIFSPCMLKIKFVVQRSQTQTERLSYHLRKSLVDFAELPSAAVLRSPFAYHLGVCLGMPCGSKPYSRSRCQRLSFHH